MRKYTKLFCSLFIIIAMICSVIGCGKTSLIVTDTNKDEVMESLKIMLHEKALVKGDVPETSNETSFNIELPDITNYVTEVKGSGELDVEIFLPLENNGSNIRNLVTYVAEQFNNESFKNGNNQTTSVTIRCLDATLAEDYIKSGNYLPKGYIASNELYGLQMKSNGINVTKVANRLVGNTIGICIKTDTYTELCEKYGELSIKTIIQANMDGTLKIGYTNPLNNPTGLNFVVSMLACFDENNPSSIEATTDFSEFQNTVSTVAYSTEQMLNAVENNTINAFVIEHQAYKTDKRLDTYTFIPFGIRHDYPLYELSDFVNQDEKEILKNFSEYFQSKKIQSYANELCFNGNSSYTSKINPDNYSEGLITEILKFWKVGGKASGKQIVAVFVSDISGSMSGDKINSLQTSLKQAMQYVNEEAKVGLITYNSNVYNCLPIAKFNTSQQEFFAGAVESMNAVGGTATNNALLMAIKLIASEEKNSNEPIKPIIILLSDGQTCNGYDLDDVEELIKAYGYPIYTIAYGNDADFEELNRIANINGGVFINSSTDDVGYTIKNLFNSEI